ncbi:MAG: CxxC-x17-CxxC domain-containing protein [Patescibacteria group bacterium]
MFNDDQSGGAPAAQPQGGYQGGYQRGGFSRPMRQMYDVSSMNLTCAQCGVAITELPFQPSSDRPVYCRDCNRQRREKFSRNRY